MDKQQQGSSCVRDARGRKRSRVTPLSISAKDNRWSDVIPPNSALTFAVVWDAKDGIIAFSGANLFDYPDNDDQSPISPADACDNRSQVLTISNSTIPLSENTATLAFFRDNHDFLFSTQTPITLDNFRRTQTSSTLDGLDVYLRGSMLEKAHPRRRYYSFLRELDADFKFDPRTSFANMWFKRRKSEEQTVTDEGFDEGPFFGAPAGEVVLSSAFSTTTTSTSNYVSVDIEEVDDGVSGTWSTLEAPNTPSYSRLLFADSQRSSNRRLKKRRPGDVPASPIEVLQRPDYNHTTCGSASSLKHISLPKFVRSLSLRRCKSTVVKERRVCAGVRQRIT